MDPDDPCPLFYLRNASATKPLYVDTTDYCNSLASQANNNVSTDVNTNDDEPPLLSAIIGNSMRCLDTGDILMFDMPELFPSSKQNQAFPTTDQVERMPCLSPNHRRRRGKSSNPQRQCFLLSAQEEQSLVGVSWLQKDTESGPRVVGKLREQMLRYVTHDDLDTQKAEAVDTIQRRMVERTGTAAPKALIEKLLYSLKRKRREEFKKRNDQIFEGLNWDFSSPALKTDVSDLDEDV